MSVLLNRGEMWISSLVWLCLGGPGRSDRPGGDGGPWGSHVSYPSRHGRPLRSQVTTGGLNGLCVVVQYTPHAGQSVPMLNAPQMNTCGPPAADLTPHAPPWHMRHAAPPTRTRESRDPAVSDWPAPQARVGWPGALWRAPHQEATKRGR